MTYATWHEITDETKLAELVASMTADGWVGAPLVADGDQLLNGSHRSVAAKLAGVEAPVIDIRELVEDWDLRIDETGIAHYEIAIAAVACELPEALKSEWGIDIH